MELRLILDEVPKNERINFCNYIRKQLENLFEKSYNNANIEDNLVYEFGNNILVSTTHL